MISLRGLSSPPLVVALLLALSGCAGVTYDPGPAVIENPPPEPPSTSVATLGGQKYSVIAGDTIDSVARQFGVPVDVLIQANGLVSPFELRPGQQLVVPTSGSYVVAAGDSLYRIAKQHGTTVASLAQLNGITSPYKIRVGQQLILPGSAIDSGSVAQVETLPPTTPGPTLPAAGSSKVTTEALAPPPGVSAAPAPASTPGASTTIATLPPPPLPPVNPTGPPPAPSEASGTAPALAPLPTSPAATSTNPAPVTTGSGQTAAIPPAPIGHGSGKFLWPVNGKIVSPFGAKDGGLHNDGINIAAPLGTPVRAADNGVVVYAGNELAGYGNLLLIRHSNGFVTAYAHNKKLLVNKGDNVRQGQTIALVGSTGDVDRPQLHFEIRKGDRAVDPSRYLESANASL